MREQFPQFSKGLYLRPEVHVHVEDGRSFVRRSTDKYQVLQATLVDTWASTAAGAFALSENNLYTSDAFRDMLGRLLRPDRQRRRFSTRRSASRSGLRWRTARAEWHSPRPTTCPWPDRIRFPGARQWRGPGLPGSSLSRGHETSAAASHRSRPDPRSRRLTRSGLTRESQWRADRSLRIRADQLVGRRVHPARESTRYHTALDGQRRAVR